MGILSPRSDSSPRTDLMPSICSNSLDILVTSVWLRLAFDKIIWTFERPKSSASFLLATANLRSWGTLSERV